ncbi:Sec-independent protein translocase protein TatB [Thermomonas sp.]|uniref:Sec-independent protein translocase protein TatB n=1 Tax=Thermomonas sp. TaxID=1971895 RepID=UPI00248961EC|nr:Sec-independent protein translocase protein TatB [Thermomonas sp.]MDI1252335.1 Sec-independent protein translocase protein TatB [Thermomonas sp.]
MFDFSFGEMLVVGLVALVVLGPERLPKAARFVGLWVRRARAQWYSVKSELERELATEELRRSLADGHQVMRETEAHLRATDLEIRTAVSDTATEVRAPIAEVNAAAAEIHMEQPADDAADDATDATAGTPKQDAHGQ